MVIENKNLSSDGFTVTPQQNFAGILPPFGLSLCQKPLWRFSPPAKVIGKIPDLSLFSHGPDIDINGVTIKKAYSRLVTVPQNLAAFYNIIRSCVSNEFVCDPNAAERRFMLTITRCDVEAGKSNRSGAEHWHRHAPSNRLDRAEEIHATRSYIVADSHGTQCLTGQKNRFSQQEVPETFIGLLTSFSIHRTPLFDQAGRRTVLIMSSYAPKAEESSFIVNPMEKEWLRCEEDKRHALLRLWRKNEKSILTQQKPVIPAPATTDVSWKLVA